MIGSLNSYFLSMTFTVKFKPKLFLEAKLKNINGSNKTYVNRKGTKAPMPSRSFQLLTKEAIF